MTNKIKQWSEAEIIDTFGLTKTKLNGKLSIKSNTNLLEKWLDTTTILSNEDAKTVTNLAQEALENVENWNEEDLKMNFIAFIIAISGLKSNDKFRSLYEKTVQATVEGHFLKAKTDFMIAKGVMDLVKVPYFHFQEYKKEKDPNGDPLAQLIEAFLIAQEKNKNGKPMYGAYVVGRFWYFVTMEGKNYCVSNAYNSTEEKDLIQIIAILRNFRVILETTLID